MWLYERYRKLINIDKNPWFVAVLQQWPGKILLLLLLVPPILILGIFSKFVCIIFLLIIFIPSYRRLWMLLSVLFIATNGALSIGWHTWSGAGFPKDDTMWQLLSTGFIEHQFKISSIFLVFALSTLLTVYIQKVQNIAWLRKPLITPSILLFFLIILAEYNSFSPLANMYLWAFIIIFAQYFWYIAYSLHDSKIIHGSAYAYEYGRYYPIWGGTQVPFPKGSAYLRQIEAKSPEELAVTQLKGVKLLWWASYLYLFKLLLLTMNKDIPALGDALHSYELGQYYPWYLAWECLLMNFFITMLNVSIAGHTIISGCRICGFRALRNTYKPLQSTNIAEFWNRYYYYFKELLVDLFFYPTYFRYFKNRPKLRIFTATMAAATFGNMMYHFFIIIPTIQTVGILEALRSFHVYMIYCFILGIAIGYSQLRHLNKAKKPKSRLQTGFSICFVLSFYLLLTLINNSLISPSFMINIRFFCSLFNFNGY